MTNTPYHVSIMFKKRGRFWDVRADCSLLLRSNSPTPEIHTVPAGVLRVIRVVR